MEGNSELLNKARQVTGQVSHAVLGKEREIREVFLTFLAGGHVLLNDIPGVGKTTLALALSKAMALEFGRVQFTPDVMPSDLTGFSVFHREDSQFVYHPGSVFCNLLLADEINRTSPKTQSALLEVMQEGRVTVDGVTREVPKPFLVIATQNPSGSSGTQILPDSQMDRFMTGLSIGYPAFDDELELVLTTGSDSRLDEVSCVMSQEELIEAQHEVQDVFLKETVARYLVQLVRATRESQYLELGASPRAAIALSSMAKACAWFDGRNYVTPSDVAEQLPYVLSHRIRLNSAAKIEKRDPRKILEDILNATARPPIGIRR